MAKRGRPTKFAEVEKWKDQHKKGTPQQCAAETGLALSTVYYWWRRETPTGRKSYRSLVSEWGRLNPNGSVLECAVSLGISRQTARKWLPKRKERSK